MQRHEGWRQCGYLATFSNYETITDELPGNAAATQNRLANMRALETYYFESADLLSDVKEILLYPDDYNIGEKVDAFSTANDWTIDGLETWQAQVAEHQSRATGEWDTCRHGIDDCTDNPDDLGLPSWLDLKLALPSRKFVLPESCDVLAAQFGVTGDGEHWLFLGGDLTKHYRAYCRGMATSAPKPYLKLFNQSANVTAPTYNFSSLHYAAIGGGTVTRTFEALLVEPRSDPSAGHRYLRILSGQGDFTQWGAQPLLEGEEQSALAETIGVLRAQGQGGATATANLDLTGTPFAVLSSLAIEGGAEATDLSLSVSPERKEVQISVTGGTAAVKGELLLEWGVSEP